jgi:hypothetical protein
MKADCEREINTLERKIVQLPNDTRTIEAMSEKGLDNLIRLDELFENGTVKEKNMLAMDGNCIEQSLFSFDFFESTGCFVKFRCIF